MRVASLLDVEALGAPGMPERTLVVAGELDLAAAPELEWAIETLCREGALELTIDLRHLTFMDCAGFATLVSATDYCHGRGCATRFVAGVGPVRRLIRMIEELSAAHGSFPLPAVLASRLR